MGTNLIYILSDWVLLLMICFQFNFTNWLNFVH